MSEREQQLLDHIAFLEKRLEHAEKGYETAMAMIAKLIAKAGIGVE